jgi:hypothetical protein
MSSNPESEAQVVKPIESSVPDDLSSIEAECLKLAKEHELIEAIIIQEGT